MMNETTSVPKAQVGILMGSDSDWPDDEAAAEFAKNLESRARRG